jgi:hypothetical protein
MILVAVRPNGEQLEQNAVAGDPSPEEISLNPRETVSGDIDLIEVFKGLAAANKKSDIHLFWAYNAPEGLGIKRWSGGWIFIPQQK